MSGAVVIGYLRVSTRDQAESGLGLAAQRAAIESEAVRRGWSVVWHEDAGLSGKSISGRPGLRAALSVLRRREASALVVAKLDRLSRSMLDFAGTLAIAEREGWSVIALDLGVDTSTPTGQLVANVMMSVAAWERAAIGARTREAFKAKRAAGPVERQVPVGVRLRIAALHAEGFNAADIARQLDEEGVSTANGGARWYHSTVARIIRSERRSAAA